MTNRTTKLTSQDVERLKRDERFFHAGALSAALGHASAYYGCHYGMRSTRDWAAAEFARGFEAASALLNGDYDEADFYNSDTDR